MTCFKESVVISLANIKRSFGFPFPLQNIGYYKNVIAGPAMYEDKLEMTLRLNSTETLAIDVIDGKSYHTKYPHAILKIPGCRHFYEVPEPRDSFYISYDLRLTDAMTDAGLFFTPPVWDIELSEKIQNLIRELTELMHHSHEEFVADRMDVLAFQLWQEVIMIRGKETDKENYTESRIKQIASYFQINFNKDFDIDDLISKHGFSRRSFFRHWNSCYNLSPKLYLQELKLQEAHRLLLGSNMTINEIADAINFTDCAYFCSLFKKRFGKTPLQYRKAKLLKKI